jgi:hypothetical protein
MIANAILTFVLTLLAPAMPAPASVRPDDPAFTIGVLRSDGNLIPFAVFDGKSWTTPWPRDVRWLEIPSSLESAPQAWFGKPGKPSEFTIWTDGVKGPTVPVMTPGSVPIACERRVVLRTGYQAAGAVPRVTEQPYPKVGLAVAGEVTIEPVAAVPRESEEWVRLSQAILEPFAVAEQRAIDRIPGWKHDIRPEARRRFPIQIERLYSAPMETEGWTAYFVEALKPYPPGPDDAGCGLVTSVGGWVLSGPEHRREFRLDAVVSYCDRKGATFFLPFGRLTANSRRYWVYQLAGYGVEHYIVARPLRDRIEGVAGYAAAFCPRR